MKRLLLIILLLNCNYGLSQEEITPEMLQPGVIATYTGGKSKTTVHQVHSHIRLLLEENETPHPRMNDTTGTYTWNGYVNVVRTGDYLFEAALLGAVEVKVDNQVVLKANNRSAENPIVSGKPVRLEPGILPIQVTFQRDLSVARLELMWTPPRMPRENIPHQFLGHTLKQSIESVQNDLHVDQGRLLFEELSCVKCHQSTNEIQNLTTRSGPNLSKVGSRVQPDWMVAWITNPEKLRPNTTMPNCFEDTELGKMEAYAVSSFLMANTGNYSNAPSGKNPKDDAAARNRGQQLFMKIGCATCHQSNNFPEKTTGHESLYSVPKRFYELGNLWSKTNAKELAGFLLKPSALHPDTRMPELSLTPQEANDIARFLTDSSSKKPGLPAFKAPDTPPKDLLDKLTKENQLQVDPAIPAKDQWVSIGKSLYTSRGCVNCHQIDQQKTLPLLRTSSLQDLVGKTTNGCLSTEASHAGPNYRLSPQDRARLTSFVSTAKVVTAPISAFHDAAISLKRFNCTNCHERDGNGGLTLELADQMKMLEKAENVDDIKPPLLTGVGHKMLTPWLKEVLVNGGKSRPWMSLRMPQFGEKNVGRLVKGLAHIEGIAEESRTKEVKLTAEKIEVGRLMLGKLGLGCISCHDIAGIPNTGTRGPDLANTVQRVRYEWYRQWLEVPQRMAPGTRMPQVFIDGVSTFTKAYEGKPELQAEAMWAYMSLGKSMKLPEGLETPKGLVLKVGSRPTVLRTFLPEAGNRGIAVGYPGGMNIAFDANRCRLAYAWSGSFVDANPVWNNRGGRPANIMGPKIWQAPSATPWSGNNSLIPPEFEKRANDPAFGADMPALQLFTGEKKVQFDGYELDENGYPTFSYQVLDGESPLSVQETPRPAKSFANGIIRTFKLTTKGGWFEAAESSELPQVVLKDGSVESITMTGDETNIPLTNGLIVKSGEGNILLKIQGDKLPEQWRIVKKSATNYRILLYFPATEQTTYNFRLGNWNLPKVNKELIEGLQP
ncbi:MAG: c-type cytochrome [Zavarzinella sp.]